MLTDIGRVNFTSSIIFFGKVPTFFNGLLITFRPTFQAERCTRATGESNTARLTNMRYHVWFMDGLSTTCGA